MDAGRRTKLLTIATIALVFLSGGVTGYAAAVRESDAAEAPSSRRRGFVFEQFDRTPEQQVQIDSVLRAHRKAMSRMNTELEELSLQIQAASDSLSRATGEAISQVFPPEVATEYLARLSDRRAERMRERAEAERDRPDGGRR